MTSGRDRALLLVAVLAISTGAVLIRGAEAAPPLVIAAYRVGLGSLIILLPGVRPDRWRSLGAMRPRTRMVAVIAGLFLAGHFATWIASLRYTSVASSVALVTAHPLIVAVVGRMVLGEKVPGRTLVGIVIGIAGVAWLAGIDHAFGEGRSLLGDGLAFSGCVFMAGYVICGRWSRSHAPLWPYLAITYSTAAVVLIGLAILDGGAFGGYSTITVVCLVLLALIPQGIGHTLVNRSLRYFSAATVSLALLGEVPGGIVLALVVLGERVPLMRGLAVAVIVLAVAWVLVPGGRWRGRVVS